MACWAAYPAMKEEWQLVEHHRSIEARTEPPESDPLQRVGVDQEECERQHDTACLREDGEEEAEDRHSVGSDATSALERRVATVQVADRSQEIESPNDS